MVLDSSTRRPVHLNFLRFVHDRNPFYLLSALCMFIGFRVILGAMDARPGDWKTLLGLIITLNVYEIVMIALALFLIVRRGLLRDGWILLGVEALFLVDLTNLNAEFFIAMPRLGMIVNGFCFVLAMAKILIVMRVLEVRLPLRTTIYIALQLAFLLALPGIFRLMRSPEATISPMQIYGMWWMVALLIASSAFLIDRAKLSDLPWRLYVMVPLISLLVHLSGENRVYWIHFQLANLAPVMLAAVFVMNQSHFRWRRFLLPTSVAVIMLAISISIVPEFYQHDLSSRLFAAAVTPLRVTLLASSAMMLLLSIRHHSLITGQAAAGCAVLAGAGSTPQEMVYRFTRIGHLSFDFSQRLIPDNNMQWGYIAIVLAFLFLAVGAVFSLHRPAPPRPMEPEVVSW